MIGKLHYQLQLTAKQADFLADSSYGHNRMSYLVSLVRMAALKPYPSLVNGSKETVGVGMVERSIKQLAGDWGLDYKTAKDMLKAMNGLGIVTTKSTPQTSTHVIHVVAAWIVDSVCILNPFFNRGYDKSAVHKGLFDSTAVAAEFTPVMDESIASYRKNLPKGGRGKRKPASDKKVVLPTINGLELYARMSAKAGTGTDTSSAQAKEAEESPTPETGADGSVTSVVTPAHEEQATSKDPSGPSADETPSDAASSDKTEGSCADQTVPGSQETADGQPAPVQDDAPEPAEGTPAAETTDLP